MSVELDIYETDYLGEILNLGLGRVSEKLSHLFNSFILLHLPLVKFASQEDILEELSWMENTQVFAPQMRLTGDLSGIATVLLKETGVLEVLGATHKGDPSKMADDQVHSIVTEAAQTMVDGVLDTVRTMLSIEITSEHHKLSKGSVSDILANNIFENGETKRILALNMGLTTLDYNVFAVIMISYEQYQAQKLLSSMKPHFEQLGLA